MRILQVVPGIGEEASGPSYSVPALSAALAANESISLQLHALKPSPAGSLSIEAVFHESIPLIPRLGISPKMRKALEKAVRSADIIHNHSLWMMPNIYPGDAVRGSNTRLLTSPRGTLSPWALSRSKYTKILMWHLFQKRTLQMSDCIHATSEAELTEIRAIGLRNPVAVIPNGIDLPAGGPPNKLGQRSRQLLFLGRVHPKKGLEDLLYAWRAVQNRFPEWELVIAGPGNPSYLSHLNRLHDSLRLTRCKFVGPVYGQAKWATFGNAELFVLPTRSENFGMAVAEALAAGVPALVSHGAPWRGLEDHDCGWWVPHGTQHLSKALLTAMAMSPVSLQAMGRRGRAWMASEYSWSSVGRMMLATYHWLLGGGIPPQWVYLH